MNSNDSVQLLLEINELRNRLDQIEKKISEETSNTLKTPYQQTPPVKNTSLPISPSVKTSSTFQDEKKRFGTGGLLGIIGILCFVLAVSFFIQLAIESGWLTPFRQILLAALFGSSLIFGGFLFRNRDIPYVSMLPGAGIVVWFLTSYAAGYIHKLIDEPTTLVCITLTSIASLSIYIFFREIYYILIAAVGAYFCPLLINKTAVSLTDFMALFILWDLTFAYLSFKIQSRETCLVASYLALLVFFEQTFLGGQQTDMALIACFQFVQFLIFFGVLIKHSIQQKNPLSTAETWSFFPLLILFYELEYIIVNRISENLAPILSLVFGGLILSVYFFSKKKLPKKNLESEPMVFGFISILLYQSLYWENQSSMHSPWFAILLLCAVPYFSKIFNFKKNFLVSLVIFLVIVWEYIKLLFHYDTLGSAGYSEYILLNMIFGSLLAMFYMRSPRVEGHIKEDWLILLGFAYVQILFSLFKIGKMITHALSFGIGDRFMVSLLWGLFAILILTLGKIRKDAFLARTSLFIFVISIGKVFFFDMAGVGSMARVLCLLALGGILYFGGYLYRHIETWEK